MLILHKLTFIITYVNVNKLHKLTLLLHKLTFDITYINVIIT